MTGGNLAGDAPPLELSFTSRPPRRRASASPSPPPPPEPPRGRATAFAGVLAARRARPLEAGSLSRSCSRLQFGSPGSRRRRLGRSGGAAWMTAGRGLVCRGRQQAAAAGARRPRGHPRRARGDSSHDRAEAEEEPARAARRPTVAATPDRASSDQAERASYERTSPRPTPTRQGRQRHRRPE